MFNTIYQIIRTARPRQWLKNLSLFAAATFSGELFETHKLIPTAHAFVAFSMLASGIYFINDIIDRNKDKKHPIKSNRPIASGKLSVTTAKTMSVLLIIGALIYSWIFVGTYFTYVLIFYVLLQFAYSLYFRNVIILDSMIVAVGFIIRVFAGGLASSTSISSWLLLATIGISLLLAFGKRRSEKTILIKFLGEEEELKANTRKTLRHYPDTLLDSMISMSATYTLIAYSLFAFQLSPQAVTGPWATLLPSILRSPKWMMATIPIVIYGVARYLYVIYEKGEGESPERVLLSDKALFTTVLLWGLSILTIIYLLPLFD